MTDNWLVYAPVWPKGKWTDGDSARKEPGRRRSCGLVVVQYRRVHPGCQHDDPAEHGQECVSKREQREPRIPRVGRLVESPLRALILAVEVQPPQRRCQRQPQHGGHGQPRRELAPLHADPDGDDGLPQGNEHDQTMALDEVSRADAKPADRSHGR